VPVLCRFLGRGLDVPIRQALDLVRPRSRLRADNGEAILQWAIAGSGVAQLPTFLLSDAIESHQLVPLLRDYLAPEYGLYVVRPPGQNVPGKVRALIDLMVERFGGEPVWDRCMMKDRERDDSGLPDPHGPPENRPRLAAVADSV
jgi:DNA-binding transcriptional LysR family regulator